MFIPSIHCPTKKKLRMLSYDIIIPRYYRSIFLGGFWRFCGGFGCFREVTVEVLVVFGWFQYKQVLLVVYQNFFLSSSRKNNLVFSLNNTIFLSWNAMYVEQNFFTFHPGFFFLTLTKVRDTNVLLYTSITKMHTKTIWLTQQLKLNLSLTRRETKCS